MDIPYAVTSRPDTGLNNARLGLWLFLASEAMLFGGLISAYVFLRTGSQPGDFGRTLAEAPLAAINTLILLTSSATITISHRMIREGSIGGFRNFLGITITLGSLFIGLKWVDYAYHFSIGHYPSVNTYLAIYFALTGVHALHVLGGLLVHLYLWATARRTWDIEPDRLKSRAHVAAVYWNFVDAVWIILFILLYIS